MKFAATVKLTTDGQWTLRHESPAIGLIEVTASTREQATEKLIGEIRYRLELCPCSGESYQHIKIDVVDASTPLRWFS